MKKYLYIFGIAFLAVLFAPSAHADTPLSVDPSSYTTGAEVLTATNPDALHVTLYDVTTDTELAGVYHGFVGPLNGFAGTTAGIAAHHTFAFVALDTSVPGSDIGDNCATTVAQCESDPGFINTVDIPYVAPPTPPAPSVSSSTAVVGLLGNTTKGFAEAALLVLSFLLGVGVGLLVFRWGWNKMLYIFEYNEAMSGKWRGPMDKYSKHKF